MELLEPLAEDVEPVVVGAVVVGAVVVGAVVVGAVVAVVEPRPVVVLVFEAPGDFEVTLTTLPSCTSTVPAGTDELCSIMTAPERYFITSSASATWP